MPCQFTEPQSLIIEKSGENPNKQFSKQSWNLTHEEPKRGLRRLLSNSEGILLGLSSWNKYIDESQHRTPLVMA